MASAPVSDDVPCLDVATERELRKQAWQDELDRKVEEYFGSHIYLRMRDGYIADMADLRTSLTEHEFGFVLTQLRQAVVDYERFLKHGWNSKTMLIGNYPKLFRLENGDRGREKRQCLIQIFI